MTKKKQLCPICKEEIEENTPYCSMHNLAKKVLKEGYERWLKAYGVLSWDDYIRKIIDLHGLTGEAVQAVAEHERFFKQT